MNKTSIALLISIACASFLLGQTITSKAEGKSFAGVMPFMTSAGYFGLFNQNDGKVYIYDGDIKKCVYEGKFDELGKPAVKADVSNTAPAVDVKTTDIKASTAKEKANVSK